MCSFLVLVVFKNVLKMYFGGRHCNEHSFVNLSRKVAPEGQKGNVWQQKAIDVYQRRNGQRDDQRIISSTKKYSSGSSTKERRFPGCMLHGRQRPCKPQRRVLSLQRKCGYSDGVFFFCIIHGLILPNRKEEGGGGKGNGSRQGTAGRGGTPSPKGIRNSGRGTRKWVEKEAGKGERANQTGTRGFPTSKRKCKLALPIRTTSSDKEGLEKGFEKISNGLTQSLENSYPRTRSSPQKSQEREDTLQVNTDFNTEMGDDGRHLANVLAVAPDSGIAVTGGKGEGGRRSTGGTHPPGPVWDTAPQNTMSNTQPEFIFWHVLDVHNVR